ncbi:MAG: hypothetical protein RMJ38_03120 [candidate division WOR-3 bacterium]|nr:hypothetical protein [candidate division WOR-3 bacterium]MDW8150414.1 hypothetical protein [candidate division WOR-3 bacterium]
MEFLRLLWKDFLIPIRSLGFFISYISYNFLILIIFSIAIPNASFEAINGIFWSVLFINSVVFCMKIMEDEFIEDAFFVLLNYFHLELILLSKLVISSIYLIAVSLINVGFIYYLFSKLYSSLYFFIFVICSSVSISAISIMLYILIYKTQSKGILLYLLYVPLAIPILLSSINGSIEFKIDWLFLSLICLFLYTSFLLFYSEKAIL